MLPAGNSFPNWRSYILLLLFLTLTGRQLSAQTCTGTGNTPSSAFLLCGSEPIKRSTVPACGNITVPVPCNGTFQNTNPTWFKVNCYTSGTLGFVITPDDLTDNFDWQLFDITNRNDEDVYTDASLFIACNWSPEPGETGASADGVQPTICTEAGADRFSTMPQLQQGREYMLLISKRSSSAGGFAIQVSGGSASITDPEEPLLTSVTPSCNGAQVTVLLNKRMLCSSISPSGSEFVIQGGPAIVSAQILDCDHNQEGNTVILTLASPITTGTYQFAVQGGNDGNTILDRCNRYIIAGTTLPLVVPPPQPTPLTEARFSGCGPTVLRVPFRRFILCNSLASDGSDFIITGPQAVTIAGIRSNCGTGNPPIDRTREIEILLSAPIAAGGTYHLTLANGSDGNTIIDECGLSTPAGSSVPFDVANMVSADFTYTVDPSCKINTVQFSHPGGNQVNSWDWRVNNTSTGQSQQLQQSLGSAGEYTVQLIVSNGTCKDTAQQVLKFDNEVKAAFTLPDVVCPLEVLRFTNDSRGPVDQWRWELGNGYSSSQQLPVQYQFPFVNRETQYTIRLIAISNQYNCRDTAEKVVKVLHNCYIAVPSAFTPNGDGLNDYLQPSNAVKAEKLSFKIFNRYGQAVFESRDWQARWDGRFNGMPQPAGVYVWHLQFTYRDTGERIMMKGTTVLIR